MIKITCEHNKYSNSNCYLFRIERTFFILKHFVYLEKHLLANITNNSYMIFLPILNIANVKSILCFSDALVIDRKNNQHNDFYIIESIVTNNIQFLSNIYQQINLLSLEMYFNDKQLQHTFDQSSFIKCQLTHYINKNIGKILQAHGGYCLVKHVSSIHKQVLIQLIGNCQYCKFRIALKNKIKHFLFKLINKQYQIYIQ